MKRIIKLTALVLSVVMVFGCIIISTSATSQNDGLSLVKIDTSRYYSEDPGRRAYRLTSKHRIDTVKKDSADLLPLTTEIDCEKLSIVPIDTDEQFIPYAYPERLAEEEFFFEVYYEGTFVGKLALMVIGVWSQADGYGRVTSVGYEFYDCIDDLSKYDITIDFISEASPSANIYVFYDGNLVGVLEAYQHTNGNITCEMLP